MIQEIHHLWHIIYKIHNPPFMYHIIAITRSNQSFQDVQHEHRTDVTFADQTLRSIFICHIIVGKKKHILQLFFQSTDTFSSIIGFVLNCTLAADIFITICHRSLAQNRRSYFFFFFFFLGAGRCYFVRRY